MLSPFQFVYFDLVHLDLSENHAILRVRSRKIFYKLSHQMDPLTEEILFRLIHDEFLFQERDSVMCILDKRLLTLRR